MFEEIEQGFDLLNANLLNEKNMNKEWSAEILKYVNYCQGKLEYVLNEVNSLPDKPNKAKNLKQFEDIYEEKVLYLLEDVTTEMFNLQAFLIPLKEKDEKIDEILQEIDGVEALLMLVPEEIEKIKCLMLAFLN